MSNKTISIVVAADLQRISLNLENLLISYNDLIDEQTIMRHDVEILQTQNEEYINQIKDLTLQLKMLDEEPKEETSVKPEMKVLIPASLKSKR